MSDDNTPAPADVNPGDKVAGYLLEEQIGQGGMAVVYRAYDERLDRRVALKVLAPSLAADNAFRTRFIRESRAAAIVEHPHIIPVYDAGDAGGCLFIAMRYVQGGDVRSLLADGHAVPPARAWNIVTQVASALDMAHSLNLVHRDVKPANMLIDGSARAMPARGDDAPQSPDFNTSGPVTEHIYLSDFGISKQTVASNLTSTGQFVGTLDYIAPEQIEGRGLDGRADQYSLACAAYELLCGVPPFTGPNIFALINSHLSEQPPSARKVQPSLSAGVDRVLAKAMAKAPAGRYASCADFAADLGRALGLMPGSLEADGGPTMVPVPDPDEQAKPQYQATELAGGGFAAAQAVQATPAGQTAKDPARTPAGAVIASPGVAPAGMGPQVTPDEQTMTADQQSVRGLQAPPAGQQQAWPEAPGQQAAPAQQWQGQQAPGQSWQAGGSGHQAPYGRFQPQQAYPEPGGPSGPGWPQSPPQQPRRRSRGLLIGVVIGTLVVAAAAAAVTFTLLNRSDNGQGPNGGASSPPSSSGQAKAGQTQAAAMSSLLSAMTQTHMTLQTAVLDIGDHCSSLSPDKMSADVGAIQTAASQRQSEYTRAQGLKVNALPSGSEAKTDLTQALSYSLQADNNYLTWAQEEQKGCFVSSQSSAYNEANSDSAQANTAKSNFANIWNKQIAPPYSQPTVVPGDL
ncbi:MAG TPA: protein kinase [Streptosporangiaceae bacterium]|nr:protein kinase [Streptosporangiaceae bacterium]